MMPKYRVPGIGDKTGKKRNKIYYAQTPEEAIQKAKSDGTLADISKVELISEPATEAQLNFARNLGLNFPPDITKEQMGILLDINSGGDSRKPTYKQIRLAKRIGIESPERLTRGMISIKIDEKLNQIGEFEKTLLMRIHDFFEDMIKK